MSDTGVDFSQLLQTAQQMQQRLQKVQEDLAKMSVEAAAGGGMVVARASGKQQLLSIHIEREVIDPDEAEMLQDLVLAAVNQALLKSAELAREEVAKVAGPMGLNLPGML